jgi:hypothetical protein
MHSGARLANGSSKLSLEGKAMVVTRIDGIARSFGRQLGGAEVESS